MSWTTETDCCPWPAHCACATKQVRSAPEVRHQAVFSGSVDLNASGDSWEMILLSLQTEVR